jgi:hypothetical protein
LKGLVFGGFAVVIGAMILVTGMVSFSGPSLPTFKTVDVKLSMPTEARITAIEPISLDCRARVYAEVPVEGIRQQEAFGVVYRTDRVSMYAYGDVDTCVDGSATVVTHHSDGSTDVVIPGESILFVRPRVDVVRTASSVRVDRDMVGKLADALPWADDDLGGLTPMAYAYAQNVIGSSECMRAAYAVTEQILLDAYRNQVIDQGVAPDRVTVRVAGSPRFIDPEPIDLGDLEMRVGHSPVTCTSEVGISAATDLGAGPVATDGF